MKKRKILTILAVAFVTFLALILFSIRSIKEKSPLIAEKVQMDVLEFSKQKDLSPELKLELEAYAHATLNHQGLLVMALISVGPLVIRDNKITEDEREMLRDSTALLQKKEIPKEDLHQFLTKHQALLQSYRNN